MLMLLKPFNYLIYFKLLLLSVNQDKNKENIITKSGFLGQCAYPRF